jgi:hypothetical protein
LTDNNSTAPVELTCQWFEDGAPVGQQFVDNSPEEFSQFSNTASASTPTIFSTNVYAPPQPTLYGDGYGYGHPRLATFTLNCMQTVFSFVGGTATSKIQVSGNDTAGLAGPQVYQSVDQYSEDNSYPGYSARHHVKVK